jgi:VPDSG-CTERM motif
MKNILTVVAVAAVAMALTQTVQAIPLPYISGNIAISGAATLNTTSVNTASKVTTWGVNTVSTDSGSFPLALDGQIVNFSGANGWSFNSGVLNNFWSVGGFTFNLISSTISIQGNGLLYVLLNGTVSSASYTTTDFTGSMTIQNPPGSGCTFSESLSFGSVPDGASTILLLGSALSGLALIKRKIKA